MRAKAATAVVGLRGLAIAATALGTIVAAQALSAADFGRVTAYGVLVAFAAVAGTGGYDKAALRDIASTDRPAEAAAVVRSVAAHQRPWASAAAIAAVPLTVVSIGATLREAVACGLLTLISVSVRTSADVLRARGSVVLPLLSIGRLGAPLQLGAAAALLLGLRAVRPETAVDALTYLGLLAGPGALLAIWLRWLTGRDLPERRPGAGNNWRPADNRSFVSLELVALLYTQVDVWVGAVVLDEQALGHYAAAARLVGVAVVAFGALQRFVLPDVPRRIRTEGVAAVERYLVRSARLGLLLSVPGLLLAIVRPQWIIATVMGDQYVDGGPVLRILALGQLVNMGTGFCGAVLMMLGHQRDALVLMAAGAASTVVGGWLLESALGPIGLAVAAAVTTAAVFALMVVRAAQVTGIRASVVGRRLLPAGPGPGPGS